jgi:ABC-type multidrug transport system ATPase subunit
VLQDDKLYPQMTVNETLMLAAHFYLPSDTSDETKQDLVTNVITELGLIKTRDTPIGNEKKRGVSGGERKRVCIAVQLISNPQILFLDEPTSGLDSFQALSVMDSMKDMARNGRLVISVIHQPRSSIFEMFDKLLLLSNGRIMFSGAASEAQSWFTSAGYPCPKLFNPSDFFLDILSPDNRTADLDALTQARIKMLGDRWEAHAHASAAVTVSPEEDSFSTGLSYYSY